MTAGDDRARRFALASLVLLPLLVLWPCALGGRTFVPYDLAAFPPASQQLTPQQLEAVRAGSDWDVTEVPPWFLPELRLSRDEVLAGRAPVWNPSARGGSVTHGHGLLGLCYPPNWLALFAADPADRLVWLCWISLALAGVLAFGFLRELGLPTLVAWFGAATFALSGPLAANGYFWMRLASLVWLPGFLWALARLSHGDAARWRPLAASAATFALPWLAGYAPFATTQALLGGLFAIGLVVARARERGTAAARALAARLAAAVALGVLLAMPQVLPSLQFFAVSARPSPTLAATALSAFEPYGLLGYLTPGLFGHPSAVATEPYARSPLALWLGTLERAGGGAAEPNYNYTEYTVFVGTLALLLAGYGAVRARGRGFALAAFAWFLGLALFVPGLHLLFALPGFQNVWPLRWPVAATFLVVWLATLGLDRLRAAAPREIALLAAVALLLGLLVPWLAARPAAWHAADPMWFPQRIGARFGLPAEAAAAALREGGIDRCALSFARAAAAGADAGRWLLLFGGLLLAFAGAGARPALRAALLRTALGAAVLQLAVHAFPLLHGRNLEHPTATPVHAFLRGELDRARAAGGFAIARAAPLDDGGRPRAIAPDQLPPGELIGPGLRDLHWYSHYDARSAEPLARLFGEAWAGKGYLVHPLPDDERLRHPLLDLLGVRFLLATAPLAHAGAHCGPELRSAGGEFFVYERATPLPRAFVVPELRVCADDAQVLAGLLDPGFAPRSRALVTAADASPLLPLPPAAANVPPRAVAFVRDHPSDVELEVAAGAGPWLVLADTWLPGWSVTVDGADAPMLRVNHAQRLVRLPPEACRVRFVYRAPGLALGLALAGFATLVLLGLAVRRLRTPGAASSDPRGGDETAE